MTFMPVGWNLVRTGEECGAQSYYSGGVLAECTLPRDHAGKHEGRDRWNFHVLWPNVEEQA